MFVDKQIEAMRMGVEYRYPIRLRAFTVMVRPLTCGETDAITAEVNEFIKMAPEKDRSELTVTKLMAKKYLERCTTSAPGATDPQLTEAILNECTNAELNYLYKQYMDVEEKVNPSVDAMSKEEINELVESVKKNLDSVTQLSISRLVNLVRTLLTPEG